MAVKILIALLPVVGGIGAAILLFWVLNKSAEALPGKAEHRLKPYVYILPAYAAIIFFMIYTSLLTVINSFKDSNITSWVGFENFHRRLSSHDFQQTLLNPLLWIIIVPTATVIIGLAVATLAAKLS